MTSLACAHCEKPCVGEGPWLAFRSMAGGRPLAEFPVEAVFVHPACLPAEWHALEDGWWRPEALQAHLDDLSMMNWFDPWMVDTVREMAYSVQDAAAGRAFVARSRPRMPTARDITATLRAQIMERDRFKCRRCGCGPERRELVVDHIQPVSRGGWKDPANLQTLCVLCNAGKRDRAPTPRDIYHSDWGKH